MLIRRLHFVVDYVTALNVSLKQLSSDGLTKSQSIWLVTVLIGMVVTNSFNWAEFTGRSQ